MRRVITLSFSVQAKTRSTNRTRASRHSNSRAILGRSFVPPALNVAVSHTIIGPRETGRQLGEGAKNSDRAAARFGLNRPIKSRQSHCRRESSEDRLLFFTRRTRLPGRSAVRPSQRGSPIRERGLVPWTIWDPRIGHTTKNLTPFCHGCCEPEGDPQLCLPPRGATGTSRGKEQKPVMHPSGRHNRTNKSKWLLSPLSLPFSTRPPWSPPARPPTPTP